MVIKTYFNRDDVNQCTLFWVALQWPFKMSPSYNLLFINLKKSETCYFDSLITSESLNSQTFKKEQLFNNHIWPSSKKKPFSQTNKSKNIMSFQKL
jgi:hypothetical protein